ncbi:MAG: DNA polymerase/3'-5' exonuclease PolX [Bacillota bacterium]
MTKYEVAWALNEIADLLEIKGEENIKVAEYRKVADYLIKLDTDFETFLEQCKYKQYKDINRTRTNMEVFKEAGRINRSGNSSILKRLRSEIPYDLQKMLQIPGLDAKLISTFQKELGISAFRELEQAAKDRKIRLLPGMGSKTELTILRGIDLINNPPKEFPLGVAMSYAKNFCSILRSLPHVNKVAISGDLRRGLEMVEEIILLVESPRSTSVTETMVKHPLVKKVLSKNKDMTLLLTKINLPLIIKYAGGNYYLALHTSTGPSSFVEKFQQIYDKNVSKNPVEYIDEKEIYRDACIQYIPPELRDTENIIEIAQKYDIPSLVQLKDIKGDLHLHSNWSDGVNGINELVNTGMKKGYEYIAITDHSKSLAIARGLSEDQVHKQHAIISDLNAQLNDFKVFTGIEVDILKDGQLDYDDDLLCSCDVVIASVHNNLRQDEETITGRIEMCLKNPHVDILAHPTGRILGRRSSTLVNMERIFSLAEKTGTALEINSSPDRLDLSSEHVKLSQQFNIPIVINTDAHASKELCYIEYGVANARRGWLTKEKVINTKGKKEMEKWLIRRK